MGFITGWASLIKRLVPLNTIFGTRAVKLAGINDANNVISDTFTFTAPNMITFPSTPPEWMTSGPGKYFRITFGGGPNNSKLLRFASVSGNTVTVTGGPVVNFVGTATIDGRIWAVINDPIIARPTNTGATMYNVHNRSTTIVPGDGSAVAIVLAEHYHEEQEVDPDDGFGEMLFHKRNSIGEFHLAISDCSGKNVPIGPLPVVDRCGNAIRTRTRPQPVDVCFPKGGKCPGETCSY